VIFHVTCLYKLSSTVIALKFLVHTLSLAVNHIFDWVVLFIDMAMRPAHNFNRIHFILFNPFRLLTFGKNIKIDHLLIGLLACAHTKLGKIIELVVQLAHWGLWKWTIIVDKGGRKACAPGVLEATFIVKRTAIFWIEKDLWQLVFFQVCEGVSDKSESRRSIAAAWVINRHRQLPIHDWWSVRVKLHHFKFHQVRRLLLTGAFLCSYLSCLNQTKV